MESEDSWSLPWNQIMKANYREKMAKLGEVELLKVCDVGFWKGPQLYLRKSKVYNGRQVWSVMTNTQLNEIKVE